MSTRNLTRKIYSSLTSQIICCKFIPADKYLQIFTPDKKKQTTRQIFYEKIFTPAQPAKVYLLQIYSSLWKIWSFLEVQDLNAVEWTSIFEKVKINKNNIELIRIGPRWGLNPQPQDCGAPTLPTLPSGSVFISLMYAVHPKSNDLMFEFEKNLSSIFFCKNLN